MASKIFVSDLKVGMFVADLDRPWVDTPFLLQGFLVENDEQILALRTHCEYVMVDRARSTGAEFEAVSGISPATNTMPPMRGLRMMPGAAEGDPDAVTPLSSAEDREARKPAKRQRSAFDRGDAPPRASGGAMPAAGPRGLASSPGEAGAVGRGLQVSVYLASFGRHVGFPKAQLSQLAQIGLLLDIGKIKLPRWLLEKQGRLTAEEYEEAKRHVAHGIAILSETPNADPEVLEGIEQHHERMNGSGYPNGYVGDEIGIYGRMAGIVDTFAAPPNHRPHAGAARGRARRAAAPARPRDGDRARDRRPARGADRRAAPRRSPAGAHARPRARDHHEPRGRSAEEGPARRGPRRRHQRRAGMPHPAAPRASIAGGPRRGEDPARARSPHHARGRLRGAAPAGWHPHPSRAPLRSRRASHGRGRVVPHRRDG